MGGAKANDRKKAWSSINHSILSAYHRRQKQYVGSKKYILHGLKRGRGEKKRDETPFYQEIQNLAYKEEGKMRRKVTEEGGGSVLYL